MSLIDRPVLDSSDTKLCRSSRGVEYLDLEERSRIDEWEELERLLAEDEEPDAQEAQGGGTGQDYDDDDEIWGSSSPGRPLARTSSFDVHPMTAADEIRALFSSLDDEVVPPGVDTPE
jgi:hypothetical protein